MHSFSYTENQHKEIHDSHTAKKVTFIFLLCIKQSYHVMASLVVQLVKNLPAMQETLVSSLGQEDPLVKG